MSRLCTSRGWTGRSDCQEIDGAQTKSLHDTHGAQKHTLRVDTLLLSVTPSSKSSSSCLLTQPLRFRASVSVVDEEKAQRLLLGQRGVCLYPTLSSTWTILSSNLLHLFPTMTVLIPTLLLELLVTCGSTRKGKLLGYDERVSFSLRCLIGWKAQWWDAGMRRSTESSQVN